MTSLDNPHLATSPVTSGPSDASSAIIGVHGRGQDPSFIAGLRDRMNERSALWIVPSAAHHEWYGHRFMERPAEDEAVLESLEAVDILIAQLNDRGCPAERITLLGFSQGACLLAEYALTRPRRYAGLVLLTGGYLGRPEDPVQFSGDLGGTPTLIASIDEDPWVPLSRVLETDAQFRRLNASATLLIEPGNDHAVSNTAVELAARMLASSAP